MTEHSLLLESSPHGWMPVNFSDVCTRVQETATPSADGERYYLGLEHIASGLPGLVGRGKEADVRSGKTAFHKGDVLFGKLRPYLRKSALVNEDGICSTDILVFRATERCIPELLCFLTHTDEFVGHAKATTSGVQHPRTSWAALREFKLHIPPLHEQRKIATALGLVQRAIEEQKRLLAVTNELGKTLLHKLFTKGLRGEPQKQTEIGPVPKSWEVVSLSSLLNRELQNGVFIRRNQFGKGVLFANVADMYADTYVNFESVDHVNVSSGDICRYGLSQGDILVVRSSLKRDGIGQNSVVGSLSESAVFDCHLIRVVVNKAIVLPEFLSYYWRSPIGKLDLIQRSKTVTMTTINQAGLSGALVPKPTIDQQTEIVDALLAVEASSRCHDHKKRVLMLLFRTLLHKLMTAQIRVHDLDLSERETDETE